MPDCSICCEPFNSSKRVPLKCPHCQEEICRLCIKKYLLSIINDPHCMMCNYVWSFVFLYEALPKSFIMGDLKRHRQDVLLKINQAYLPEFQIRAEEEKQRQINQHLVDQLKAEKMELNITLSEARREHINNLKEKQKLDKKDPQYKELVQRNKESVTKKKRIRDEIKEINRSIDDIRFGHGRGEKRKEVVHRKCPGDNCRGFLNDEWECGLCEKKTCKRCYIQINGEHTCKEEDIETTKLLKKDTKPCPKCGMSISKIDGCNQMFCTLCHQVFDWATGRSVTGNVHNPHYFEWRRRMGQNERNPDDLPCGGLPQYINFPRVPNGVHVAKEDRGKYNRCNDILRLTHHIRDNTLFDDNYRHQDLGVQYLLGRIDEARWKKLLADRERDHERKRAYHQIIQMYILAATDIFQKIVQIKGYKSEEFNQYYQELEALIEYHNDEITKVGMILKNAYESYLITEDRIENRMVMRRYR